jgi:hypothetical protein
MDINDDDNDVSLNNLQRKVLKNLWSEYMNNDNNDDDGDNGDDDVYLIKLQRKVLQNLWSKCMSDAYQPIWHK